jgi:hypothetical protein
MLQLSARLERPMEVSSSTGGARCRLIDDLLGIATAALADRKT